MARPTKAQETAIRERRAAAVHLRIAGVEPLAIGKKLAADPAINTDGVAFPMGYGSERYTQGKTPPTDKQLIIRVCQDLQHAREAADAAQVEAVADLRFLHNQRLDQVLLAHMRPALGGGPDKTAPDAQAAGVVLKVLERQARLNGLDAPSQAQIAGKGGNPIQVTIDPDLLPPRMDVGQPPVE